MKKQTTAIGMYAITMSLAFMLNQPAFADFPPGLVDGTYLPTFSDDECPVYAKAIDTSVLRLRAEGNPVTQMPCAHQGGFLDYYCDSVSCTASNGTGKQVSFRGSFLNLMLSSGETLSFKYYDHNFYVPNDSGWKSYDGPPLGDF